MAIAARNRADDLPEEPAPPETESILMIDLDRIEPSPKNPRRFRDGVRDPKIREIAESINAVGVLHPILVRPVNSHYEIMAGERRWHASRLAGRPTIPAIVRELDDKAALEITVIENMQREDLHPIEEARGLKELLDAGYTAEDAAARLGKSTAWISCRAQLAKLIPEFASAMSGEDENINLTGWSVRAMELVARLPESTQKLLWGKFLEHAESNQNVERIEQATTKTVEMIVARFMLDLKTAPWEMDACFGDCPVCAQCSKRSQAQPDLFGGDEDEDRCLDPQCWEKKSDLYTEQLVVQAERDYPGILKVSSDYQTDLPGVLGYQHYTISREGAEGAVPAVVVEGRSPEMIWVKVDSGERSRKAVANVTGEKQDESTRIAARKAQYDKLRRRIVMDLMATKLKDLVEDGVGPTCAVTPQKMLACILATGLPYSHLSTMDYASPWPIVQRNLDKSEGELMMDLALQMAESFNKRLHSFYDEPKWGEALALSELFGIKLDALLREAAVQKPYPKSWRAQAESLPPSPIPERALYSNPESRHPFEPTSESDEPTETESADPDEMAEDGQPDEEWEDEEQDDYEEEDYEEEGDDDED
ncbi:ParB/RepB/Spo0J family partition protein [bacterium]|nr:ParB/RepB/Spo0J family partition protein [bacterium]